VPSFLQKNGAYQCPQKKTLILKDQDIQGINTLSSVFEAEEVMSSKEEIQLCTGDLWMVQ